jgi:hypothetical protein
MKAFIVVLALAMVVGCTRQHLCPVELWTQKFLGIDKPGIVCMEEEGRCPNCTK